MARVTTIGRETPGAANGQPLAVADTSERAAHDKPPPRPVFAFYPENRAQQRKRERRGRR
jgi:hypothetical protein